MSFHKQTFHQRTTRTKEPTKRERLDYQIELINNRLKELGSKEFIDYGIAYGGYRLETKGGSRDLWTGKRLSGNTMWDLAYTINRVLELIPK